MIKSAMFCLLLLILTQSACAASLDCAKASTEAEKIICKYPGLLDQEKRIVENYEDALRKYDDKSRLADEQKKWRSELNKCKDFSCVSKMLRSRLVETRYCERIPDEIDRFLCGPTRLFFQDKLLREEFRLKIEESDDKQALIDERDAWFKKHRELCGTKYSCWSQAYDDKFDELRNRGLPLTENIPKHPFILEEGKGMDVCESYQDNLNSFLPNAPRTEINTKLPGFEHQPEWKQMHTVPTGEAVYSYYLEMGGFLWKRDVNPVGSYSIMSWPKWTGSQAQVKEAKRAYDRRRNRAMVQKQIAMIDMDNDGTEEPVYYENGEGSRIAAIKPDWSGIDWEKTRKLMPRPPFGKTGRDVFRPLHSDEMGNGFTKEYGYTKVEDAWNNLYSNVFIYRGTVYFGQWWGARYDPLKNNREGDARRLRVYMATSEDTKKVCVYSFKMK